MVHMSPKVSEAFFEWLRPETWHTGHPCDDERFYRFVWRVVKLSKKPPSESDIRALVVKEWYGNLEESYLLAKADEFSNLYATLLEFARVRNKGRPMLLSDFE